MIALEKGKCMSRRRHKIIYWIFRHPVWLFLKIKFGYKYKKIKKLPENYLVISNHTTDYDPLMVAMSFKKQMYYVASEHISNWGLASKLLKFGFDPILRSKGTIAASTVKAILRRLKGGDNVCLFAEGTRTWDGVTNSIHPSTASLVRAGRCGLVTYKLTGGYFSTPMWSASGNVRRGPISGAPVNVYTKEQIAAMSDLELAEAINRDLYEDAYARQLSDPKRYKSKNGAEGLESLIFMCPSCNKYDTLSSQGNTVRCEACGLEIGYDEYGMLSGIEQKTVYQLASWQREKITEDVGNGKIYEIEESEMFMIRNHERVSKDKGKLSISCESLICGDVEIPIGKIPDMAMHGKYALVFSYDGEYIEIVATKRSNMLKFQLYYQDAKKLIVAQKEKSTL
jgi:1-acyl-sn-glycerol-3-phosphate acyltransferase